MDCAARSFRRQAKAWFRHMQKQRGRRFLSLSGGPATYSWCVFCLSLLVIALLPVSAWGHGSAGKRFFPTTFQVDDPFIGDEGSVLFNSIKGPDAKTNELDFSYAKRITPNFGLEFDDSYQHLSFSDGGSASGWGNLGIGLKYQFFTSDEHETIMSLGVGFEIGGTGARSVGADSFSTVSPAFYFGKGFGDLPDSLGFLKPLAITGVIGVNFPTRSTNVLVDPDTGDTETERNPSILTWGFTLQYSIPYLQSFVRDIGLGVPFNKMIPLVEFPMQTCLSADCKGKTTGFINPGLLWIGKYIELGIAANIPVNSRSGSHVGILGLIHFFLDDIFPKSIGRPVFP